MSYIDVTFERSVTIIKTIARVSAGWDRSKQTWQFYAQEMVDFRGDIKLAVKVWLKASKSVSAVRSSSSLSLSSNFPDFPPDINSTYEAVSVKAGISNGCLTFLVHLQQALPWIPTANGKFAIDWGPYQIALSENVAYVARHMIVFNLPYTKKGDFKEWDLLPFVPGGLIESNRRRH